MKLKVALPKGRLFEESVSLFFESKLIDRTFEEGRKLSIETENFIFYLVKPFDVPIYVERGIADLGICGFDVFLERKPDVYRFIDLKIGKCRISVAGKKEKIDFYKNAHFFRVATKYVNITKEFFLRKGVNVEIISLSGSVELAPVLGLSDFIVDLVQTGRTLKENDLVEIEVIDKSSAWLIGNRASFRNKRKDIVEVIDSLYQTVLKREERL